MAGIGPFELHLGRFTNSRFSRGIQDEHRDHTSADNLLKPYNLEIRANAARQSWDVDGMRLEIALGRRRSRAVRVVVRVAEARRDDRFTLAAGVIRPRLFRTTSRNRST
jgi:hypothetical protein